MVNRSSLERRWEIYKIVSNLLLKGQSPTLLPEASAYTGPSLEFGLS